MIHHTKLFVRRLAYLPWLLTAGLVLGWTGEAAAQVALEAVDANATEGSPLSFTVTLSGPSSEEITVDFSVTGGDPADTDPIPAAIAGTDFTAITGTLTFAANETFKQVIVATLQDELNEDNEGVTLTLSNQSPGATVVTLADADATALGTIFDDDELPKLSVAAGEASEGVALAFTVSLDAPSGRTVTATITPSIQEGDTAEGEAVAAVADATGEIPSDFTTPFSGGPPVAGAPVTDVTFLAGETSKLVVIPSTATTNDDTYEGNETFTVTLSAPSNATLDKDATAAKGTIIDNDPMPSLSLAVTPATLDEGATATFTVTVTPQSEKEVKVDYAWDGGTANSDDFTGDTSGTLTIAPFAVEAARQFTVATDNDGIGENAETFVVRLSGPMGATLGNVIAQTVTINVDTDQVAFSVDDVSGSEADKKVDFKVTLSASRGAEVTVAYATSVGDDDTAVQADFTAKEGALTFAANTETLTQTVSVVVVDDDLYEGDETFTLRLSTPSANATLSDGEATGTIEDDEAKPSLSVADASATEGSSVDFVVTLSAGSIEEVTVDYATSMGDGDTATSGTDFTAVAATTLTFAVGTQTQTVSVMTEEDDEIESKETFTLTLSGQSDNADLGDPTATGTIEDNDVALPVLSVGDAMGDESAEEIVFTVMLSPAADGVVTVDYATSDGTATSSADGMDADFTSMSGELEFAAGETEKMLTVAITNDDDMEDAETFMLTLSNASDNATLAQGGDPEATGTINANDGPAMLSVGDAMGDEGSTLDFVVTLSSAQVSGVAVTVDYETLIGADDTASNADFDSKSGMLEFTTSEETQTQTVSVMTTQDTDMEDAESFTLRLSNAEGAEIADADAMGTINASDGAVSLSVADASGNEEDGEVVFTVTLSEGSELPVTVDYATSEDEGDNAATATTDDAVGDFTSTSGSLSFEAGASGDALMQTLTVAIEDDGSVEENETFTLTLSGQSDNATLGDATATGTIVSDDLPPDAITLTLTPASVREDGKKKSIEVKAAVADKVTADMYVTLDLAPESRADFNKRFGITLPTLVIAKGEKEIKGTIDFVPIPTDDPNTDLEIVILANGGGLDTGRATITMIDDDKESTEITLSFDPASISEEEGPTDITVTATLDGETQSKNLTFDLVIDEVAAAEAASTEAKQKMAVRDVDYTTVSLGSIIIKKRKVSGVATITLDPKARDRVVDAVLVGVGARPSGNNDGSIPVISNVIKITDTPLASAKGLTATPAMIRENAGETVIELKVELDKGLPNPEEVLFTIMDADSDDAANAVRDVDYTATVGDLTIAANATSGTTTLTVTPIDNDQRGGSLAFKVRAEVGQTEKDAIVTIIDDETPTTNIALSVDPKEIKAATGANEITVTGEIDGATFEDPVKITLVLDPSGTAVRDSDFEAMLRSLTIPAGEVSGSTTISVTALNGGDKTVVVKALKSPVKNEDEDDVTVGTATIKLKDADAPADPVDPGALRFGADLAATVFDGVIGEDFEEELPEAEGGGDTRSYSVSANLPDGLSFDTSKRMITGKPTTAEMVKVVYTVIDDKGGSAATQFTIEVTAAPPPTVAVASVEASQKSIRESGDTAEISITATLAGPAPDAETIEFRLGAPSSGAEAIRDVDYSASLGGSIPIEKGATEASTTLTLTPIDDDKVDGNKSLGVQASASGGSASVDITIADDETASTSISLSADPHTVSESDGVTDIVVTATLGGKVLDADATVTISIDPASKATRDEDYAALFNPRLTIPAGSISGSIALIIDPNEDSMDEGNETITLNGVSAGLTVEPGTITISDGMMPDDPPMMDPLAFAEGAMISDVASTAGTAIADMALPEAAGGEGDITYSVSDLPAGLAFDDSTRTISGTPEAEGTTEVTYTATDGAGETVTLTFSITVNPMLDFGDLSGLFGAFTGGAGKANPASEHDEGAIQIVVGEPYSLTIPEIPGGTPPKTYSVSGLPAGLSFDPATRTVSGTPTEVGLAAVVLTVVDAAGASGAVPIPVSVIEPPLGAPSNLVAQDYAGADGQGDQGGFLLLTWELSEHHDEIDGYRIFRALPVLGNEMVPWAMVDAVPGVARGVAIVATLDNVSTRWGIAAERGGQTTHGAAKAVFVSAENQPYAQMAETLMASMEAAQAGDAPVFASLLPEALAYAQGVAPKLNVVAGVQSSEVIFTDEPVRAIDNIAPLAVPSLSVLDAPNDEGSRIVLTWTLSPSDRLLQGVVAGAVGPAAAAPVVGVYGYNIYRRAAGEDEFAKIAQVDAGVTSFVDETALNGVRYTYQVRPYDLDNETGSDIEQTAMAVRNIAVDSEGRALFGLFGADNSIGFDDFFIFADSFGLTAEDTGFDPAFDLSPNATIDFEDFFVFADNFGRSTAAAGKRVPMFAGLNADARMYLDARTAMPIVGEDFVLDVRVADFAAIKGYGLQVQYEADKLEFVQVLTDEPLGGSAFATPQVLADEAGVLTVVAYGDVVSDGEVALSLVFRPTTEIENTLIEIADNQTYDSEFGFNRLALPAPVQLQTRPEAFALANNYPNPFNPATTIKYALPQAADVELTVYNVVGQVVRTLVAEHQSAGRYVVEWDATNDNGHSLSSGMYFYRLEAGGEFHEVKKMLLLK